MTLILTQVGDVGVIQVTDRLVSRIALGDSKPYDPQSNKNLLYLAPDGCLTIAYTGLSFIGTVPTDQWLAEQLAGYEFGKTPRGTPPMLAMRFPPPQWLAIGQSVRLLTERLDEASGGRYKTALSRVPVTLIVAGWLWYRRKRSRPFACYIYRGESGRYTHKWVERHLGRRYLLNTCPGAHLSASERRVLTRSLGGLSPTEVERTLVERIQEVARRAPGVGADCISITLSPPQFRQAIVRYTARSPVPQSVEVGGRQVEALLAYKPWILAPGVIQAPSLFGGPGHTLEQFGPYQLRIEAPPAPIGANPAGLVYFEQSQARRPAP